ncbi:hypothetical protein [Streptomyces sp. NPDC101150]|uniref:PASTA domain-containing protein n=1 Tax=Streptomyces sp. NPDC101150 TaxID=3366114 RepID=UPI00381E68B4
MSTPTDPWNQQPDDKNSGGWDPKSWSKNMKIGIGVAAGFVGLVILGAVAPEPNQEQSADASPAPTVTVTETVTETATPEAPESTAIEEDTDTPDPTPTSEDTEDEETSDKAELPDFTGKQLQAAQDGAQGAGFYFLDSDDATGQGRMQLWDRNWQVCSQEPAGGESYSTDETVTFHNREVRRDLPLTPGLLPP